MGGVLALSQRSSPEGRLVLLGKSPGWQYYSVKVFLMGILVVETRVIASLQGFAFRVIILTEQYCPGWEPGKNRQRYKICSRKILSAKIFKEKIKQHSIYHYANICN